MERANESRVVVPPRNRELELAIALGPQCVTVLPLEVPMKMESLALLMLVVACTKTSKGTQEQPAPTQQNITGTWQGPIDAGTQIVQLQFILIEDAGTITGRQLLSDPLDSTQFHTIDTLSGTHAGASVVLYAGLSGDTINATLDGGTLSGIDPSTDPSTIDSGTPNRLNLAFSMTRISTNAPILDAGNFQ